MGTEANGHAHAPAAPAGRPMSVRDRAEAAVEELAAHLAALPAGEGRTFLLACLRVLAEEARHAVRHRCGGRPLEMPPEVLGAEWEWAWEGPDG